MKDLRSRLKEISQQNFEGIQSISEMAVLQARDSIKILELNALTDKTFLYPTVNGGIQFEWNEPGIRLVIEEVPVEDLLELEILSDGSLDFLTMEDMK